MLRVLRSRNADFQRDAELADQVDTDDVLQGIVSAGFNAVWVRTINHELLPNPQGARRN